MYKRFGLAARWLFTCACALSTLYVVPLAQAQDVGSEEPTASEQASPGEAPSEGETTEDTTSGDEDAFNEAAFEEAAFEEASSGGGGGGGDSSFDEPTFSVNGMFRMQAGVFVPLMSSKFKPHENIAFTNDVVPQPCDVRRGTNQCVPRDHGQKPGTMSIARATLQLEAQWNINEYIGLHAIVRGVRSLRLDADQYARPPQQDLAAYREGRSAGNDFDTMGRSHQDWVHENLYSELDLREFYLDLFPKEWLSMRIGRQQVMWGDIAGYRILDQVNPENTTWHFGSLEQTEDIRIPNWIWLTTFDMPKIDHSLEVLWIPMVDRPKDTVTVPLSFVGAWGIPYPNAPTSFFSPNLNFRYPGRDFNDQRVGLRWKGNLGNYTSYSLQYLYTHQMGPPVVTDGYYGNFYTGEIDRTGQPVIAPNPDGSETRVINLDFPRMHIAGFSLEQNIPALGTIARLEAAFENRTYSGRTDNPGAPDSSRPHYLTFHSERLPTIKYAVQLQRPTMIRWLNPSANFLLVGQFLHTYLPTYDMPKSDADIKLVHVVSFNAWALQKHHYTIALLARTTYLNGRITLEAKGAWLPNPYSKDSGFYTVDVGYRMGPHYRLNIRVTDFVGKDPYRDMGLFRDRDEIHGAFTVLF
jgi:hypothetical protein